VQRGLQLPPADLSEEEQLLLQAAVDHHHVHKNESDTELAT
jgi:hypothetical protein